MKYAFPENHGLSAATIDQLVFKEGANPALSNAQFAALEAGVGRGDSLLVVSPTSTGKTQIALWAIAKSLESGCNTVYLVTHRALARQKFDDFGKFLLPTYLSGDSSALVIATGDYVEDADGEVPKEPLGAPLLVATYEKYLAMLSASGVPTDMRRTVIVCDEIQLLGDAHRGQSVEILLTLLRNAGWKQFVGLSAVLQAKDAQSLADWLEVRLVVETTREKQLRYECWTPKGIAVSSSERPEQIDDGVPIPAGVEVRPISVLISLLKEGKPPVPIIVFCMKKQDTYDLAREFLDAAQHAKKGQLSLAFDGLPETTANGFLAGTLECRVASHNADLTEEERRIVEQHLADGKLDVVFATTTLAAGVNFPLGAAVFASWKRWDGDQKLHVPIDSADFHNMAGRVGRMGFDHEHGRVIFFANSEMEIRKARDYLDLGELPVLEPRVTPEKFQQLALQLVASGLTSSRTDLEKLVCTTFSALREQSRNQKGFGLWPEKLTSAVDGLLLDGLLILSSSENLSATPVGKAVGYSGLLPATCMFLLAYLVSTGNTLVQCLPGSKSGGDMPKLAFLLFHACFSSPEFRPVKGSRPTRFLPYPLEKYQLFDPSEFSSDMAEPVWQADIMPVNAAKLSCDWMDGGEIRKLEDALPYLSAGMLLELFRNLCWVMQGLSAIATAASDKRVPNALRPKVLQNAHASLDSLAKLPRVMRRLSLRVSEGLPDEVLWMMSLNLPGSPFRLQRGEILALRASGYSSPEKVMLSSADANSVRGAVFVKAKPTPFAKANWLRDTCRDWKMRQRQRAAERHHKRASKCPRRDLLEQYYAMKGSEFEIAFENVLEFLKVDFEKLDDKTKTGAPDYLLRLKGSPPLVIELKSKEGDKLVDYNKAVEVLAASEVHGHKDTFCVTLCHPGVDPSVPLVIATCGRLSVVESHDLGEALLRLCEGALSEEQIWQWLATPGQALAGDLPFREYG
ncbi:DEAD/DEAH box helicase [Janthinobacterium fluminis]|uniref:DEAD/DEAH box helicase n=1 Tax=Janthinobacterium fluminis TaxID=2987524 RepID=A0ABT5K097_9BURK|nr:DEAD/DEAH box helicase [Janthinobacterium fluminis]MDC8758130.1 DEAD/DEAH box helicase [Janthinobacterium fluminis]